MSAVECDVDHGVARGVARPRDVDDQLAPSGHVEGQLAPSGGVEGQLAPSGDAVPELARSGDVEIRLARPSEYEAIDEIIAAAYANDYGPSAKSADPMAFSKFRADSFDVWVATDHEGELLGSITTRRFAGSHLHEDAADDELDLRLLGVSPSARRRGIGATLMRHIIEEAARAGFAAVVLKTQPIMHGAHRLYEELGFTRTPERDGLWIGGHNILDLFSYRYQLDEASSSRQLALDPAMDESVSMGSEKARRVLGSFPSGVVVLTAREANTNGAALTVQSFFSLSLDPLRIAIGVGRGSTSWPRIAEGGSFAITVLAEGQGTLARQLAQPGDDKLAGVPLVESPTGHPLIVGGVSWLECDIRVVHDGGDHFLVVADVRDLGFFGEGETPDVVSGFEREGARGATSSEEAITARAHPNPLLFADSRFTRLDPSAS